jgi:hypothetical protein
VQRERVARAWFALTAAVVAFAVVTEVVLAFGPPPEDAYFTSTRGRLFAPLLGFLGWVLFGPRGLVDGRVIGLATIFPLAWLAFTLLRGPVVDWYPYPFVDVMSEGYARVLLNAAVITVLWLGLAAGLAFADRWLLARQRPVTLAGVPAGASTSGPVLERGPDERRLEGEPPPGDEPRVGQHG